MKPVGKGLLSLGKKAIVFVSTISQRKCLRANTPFTFFIFSHLNFTQEFCAFGFNTHVNSSFPVYYLLF